MADKESSNSSKGAAAEEDAVQKHDDAEEHDEHAHDEHAHADHGHAAAAHAHSHKPNIKEYMVIFVVLAVLTALEVGVAQVPSVSRKLIGLCLVGLALTKAAIVGLYYMHLKHETRVLKLTVALPMAAPAIYAVVLISEAAWRLTRF